MRLWHETLLSLLPRQQLLGHHRVVFEMRKRGYKVNPAWYSNERLEESIHELA